MNIRLHDQAVRDTYRKLATAHARVSGRMLRRELRSTFGSSGKTARIFKIWREESQATGPATDPLPREVAELQRRMLVAEAQAAEYLLRAERAEYREQAHQDHWAVQIDTLREQLRAQPKYALEIRTLQERIFRLSAELQAARAQSQPPTEPPTQ